MMLHAAGATFYCLDIMSGQNSLWPDKCGKWPEIGQWPAAISSSVQGIFDDKGGVNRHLAKIMLD